MTPNIVFLDAFTCNPGDISFDELAGLGTFTAYDRTDLGQLESRAGNADIIIVNKFPINSQTLDKMPLVKYIVVAATGYNNIDIELEKAILTDDAQEVLEEKLMDNDDIATDTQKIVEEVEEEVTNEDAE